ncbi:MAG: phosphoribosylformylglycinamidine cyclo-ligase [Oceanicoccus sp.]|jgi:phosphoribosylformylglycinamidine cyclo-ligase
MTTYSEAGVNIEDGDACSRIAYEAAKATFAGRHGMIGAPAILEGGFSGALDMGDFFLVQNDDGVGSKSMIASAIGKYDTLGLDLVAMVADDAICVGAEVISLSNTVDIQKVNAEQIEAMMAGLKAACLEQKIVVPGGEIAELPDQVNGFVWNSTAMGIVEKDKLIDGNKVKEGDLIIGLRSAGFRSNGFTLVRHILSKAYGKDWANEDYGDGRTWGEILLTPSVIYHRGLLKLLGAYGEARPVDVHGLVHVTGGGIHGNAERIVKGGLKAEFTDLWEAHEPMKKLMELGGVAEEEAYKTWNMGTGMLIVLAEADVDAAMAKLTDFEAKVVGKVVSE